VDSLLVIIKLFSLGVTVLALRANIDLKEMGLPFLGVTMGPRAWYDSPHKGMGQFGPKLQVKGDIPHQTFFVSQK